MFSAHERSSLLTVRMGQHVLRMGAHDVIVAKVILLMKNVLERPHRSRLLSYGLRRPRVRFVRFVLQLIHDDALASNRKLIVELIIWRITFVDDTNLRMLNIILQRVRKSRKYSKGVKERLNLSDVFTKQLFCRFFYDTEAITIIVFSSRCVFVSLIVFVLVGIGSRVSIIEICRNADSHLLTSRWNVTVCDQM